MDDSPALVPETSRGVEAKAAASQHLLASL
jgi:hypothetical protein